VAPPGGAGLGSKPDIVVITRERHIIDTNFVEIKISKFNKL
jgi:hypothetical protein